MQFVRRILAWWLTLWVTAVVAGTIVKFTVKPEDDPTAPHFSLVAVFDGVDFRPTTRTLEASKALTMFGGTRIDLRRAATADPSEVQLEVTTIMGGVDITVPDTWRVEVEGPTVMGGREVAVTDPDALPPDAPRLRSRARTVMGGVRVQARPVLASAASV